MQRITKTQEEKRWGYLHHNQTLARHSCFEGNPWEESPWNGNNSSTGLQGKVSTRTAGLIHTIISHF